jgi:PAS domain S-box-containing protein
MRDVLDTPDVETLLASLARNIPGAIYRCELDPNWTMHLIGDEIEQITGYPASDFVHNRIRSYGSLIHLDDREHVERAVREAVDAGRPYELEYRLVTASGGERWVLERGCAAVGRERDWLDGIIFDVTDRRRFEETARRAEAEAAVARELSESRRRIVFAGDEARRRIERDLHDGAQQSFVCAALSLRSALARLPDGPEAVEPLLHATRDHLERGLGDLRELARGIHPTLLAQHGIAAAIGSIAARAPVPVAVIDDLSERLPPDVESALYFSGAEAITNAVKHAHAREISVRVGRTEVDAFVEVIDDGVGGAVLDEAGGLGGLADRLATVAGTLDFISRRGAGTRVVARVPISA